MVTHVCLNRFATVAEIAEIMYTHTHTYIYIYSRARLGSSELEALTSSQLHACTYPKIVSTLIVYWARARTDQKRASWKLHGGTSGAANGNRETQRAGPNVTESVRRQSRRPGGGNSLTAWGGEPARVDRSEDMSMSACLIAGSGALLWACSDVGLDSEFSKSMDAEAICVTRGGGNVS